ncbi:MAG TPA: hypothetical protein PLN63_06165 [Paludibacteraceae bacterium]|nr:hypothetical protein [Paludibacteraceae bacterium]HPH63186.1 hypothetical protein [Paludibacteraceae bacterium]
MKDLSSLLLLIVLFCTQNLCAEGLENKFKIIEKSDSTETFKIQRNDTIYEVFSFNEKEYEKLQIDSFYNLKKIDFYIQVYDDYHKGDIKWANKYKILEKSKFDIIGAFTIKNNDTIYTVITDNEKKFNELKVDSIYNFFLDLKYKDIGAPDPDGMESIYWYSLDKTVEYEKWLYHHPLFSLLGYENTHNIRSHKTEMRSNINIKNSKCSTMEEKALDYIYTYIEPKLKHIKIIRDSCSNFYQTSLKDAYKTCMIKYEFPIPDHKTWNCFNQEDSIQASYSDALSKQQKE